jgi:hypothetical protein
VLEGGGESVFEGGGGGVLEGRGGGVLKGGGESVFEGGGGVLVSISLFQSAEIHNFVSLELMQNMRAYIEGRGAPLAASAVLQQRTSRL